MRIDERLDAHLADMRHLPIAEPSATRAARTRARCHAALASRRRGAGHASTRLAMAADLLLAAGAGVYATAVAVEVIRLVWR